MMYLTRKDPSTSLPSLQSAVNRLFDDALGDFLSGSPRTTGWAPPVEIYDTEKELVMVAELPGFQQKDVSISFESGQLSFSGERKLEEDKNRNYHRNERWYGHFERTFQLPGSVNAEKIKATLKDGILTIIVPKRDEARARQIQVTAG